MPRSLLLFLLVAAAVSAQTPPAFEVATVRPTAGPIEGIPPIFGQQRASADQLTIRHTPLAEIVRRGFDLLRQELVAPGWIEEERFDIVAKSAQPATEAELWRMVPQLLADRFKLTYHREPREVSGLGLVIAKDGLKLKPSEGGSSAISMAGGVLSGHNVSLARLAQLLSSVMRQPVVDNTGLEGPYDFTFDPKPYGGPGMDIPSIVISGMPEALGLKLDSRKVSIQVLVIDHIERPSDN